MRRKNYKSAILFFFNTTKKNFFYNIMENNNESIRGTANLADVRSQSYILPKAGSPRPESRAHFSGMPNHIERPAGSRMNSSINVRGTPRPGLSSRGTSFASAAKRRSMVRTISSLSVYSNFAGERLDDNHRPRLNSLIDEEKRKSYISQRSSVAKHEESTVGEELIEDTEDMAPKASVGKAMFMFLKAFIGSGVLFLPKA